MELLLDSTVEVPLITRVKRGGRKMMEEIQLNSLGLIDNHICLSDVSGVFRPKM